MPQKDGAVNLDQFEARIDEVSTRADLSQEERDLCLDMTADAIDRAAWQPQARVRAAELAGLARGRIVTRPDQYLPALDSLHARGLLSPR